jgi:hypothetical protein
VYADTHDRSVFNDFGKDFACVDPTGEQPQSGMVVEIDEVSWRRCVCLAERRRGHQLTTVPPHQGEDAVVTCLDETRHGLEDGDYVTFSEIKGMEALNGCEPRKVSVKGEQMRRFKCRYTSVNGHSADKSRAIHFHHWQHEWSGDVQEWRTFHAGQDSPFRASISRSSTPRVARADIASRSAH